MPATRRRRILRWTVIAVVAPVLLLMAYASAYIALPVLVENEIVSGWNQYQLNRTVFSPLCDYEQSRLPGAKTFHTMCLWVYFQGSGFPIAWNELETWD